MAKYEVIGAGTTGANQIYNESGTYDGRPYYIGETNSSYKISFDSIFGGIWLIHITTLSNAQGNELYSRASSSSTPPLSGWITQNGSNPEPTLSLIVDESSSSSGLTFTSSSSSNDSSFTSLSSETSFSSETTDTSHTSTTSSLSSSSDELNVFSSSSSSEERCPSKSLLLRKDKNILVNRVKNPNTNKWKDFNSLYWRWRNMSNFADNKTGAICDEELPTQPDPDDFQDFD